MQTRETINRTLATLESLPTQPSKESELPRSSPEGKESVKTKTEITPLRSDWQNKWLRLDNWHPKIQPAADAATDFCKRFLDRSIGKSLLVLTGESGCGKTHLAEAIARYARHVEIHSIDRRQNPNESVPAVRFESWPEFAGLIANPKSLVPIKACLNASLLVLDDIGAENDPWKNAANVLCQILSRREFLHTVVTTNIKPDAWPEKFDTRIADRLMRNSIIVDLFGVPSYSLR